MLCLQDVQEDTDLMSDDDDEDEMEDLDALAKGMDRGRTAPLPKAASAAETTTAIGTALHAAVVSTACIRVSHRLWLRLFTASMCCQGTRAALLAEPDMACISSLHTLQMHGGKFCSIGLLLLHISGNASVTTSSK